MKNTESQIFNYRDIPNENWKLLACIDESESYEVDVSEIYLNTKTKKFILVTASGCSCWDGEYEDEEYSSLNDIKKYLLSRDDRGYSYNPSVRGAIELVEMAKENYMKLKNKKEVKSKK